MASGDSVVFTGVAYMDSDLTVPAVLGNYSNLTFSILDQVTASTYNVASTVNVINSPLGIFSVTYQSGVLTQTGSYYVILTGTIGPFNSRPPLSQLYNIMQNFYMASNNANPYLQID